VVASSFYLNRRVLVTGAGRGLGAALSHELIESGARVIGIDLHAHLLSDLKHELKTENFTAFVGDIRDQNFRLEVRRFCEKEGGLDVLINNAGVVFGGEFSKVSEKDHSLTIEINLVALMNWTKDFLPLLINNQAGRLIQIASVSGLIGFPLAASYAASKWGVIGFSESLDLELRAQASPLKITVACPSYIQTPLFEGSKPPLFTRVLEPNQIAKRILAKAAKGKFFVVDPVFMRGVPILKALLPHEIWQGLMKLFGANAGMRGWTGRSGITPS